MAMILKRTGQKMGARGRFNWMGYKSLFLSLLVIFGLASPIYAAGDSMVDPNWKAYTRVSGISGSINSIGSDTFNNLMTLWAEGFRKQYPNVKIQIEGKGSSTAPPALIEGTGQLGPMSRKMKGKEMDKFEAKFGYKPTPFPVAIDALAVYVNKDNPVNGMTMDQIDAAFSKTRRRGYPKKVKAWGQLVLKPREGPGLQRSYIRSHCIPFQPNLPSPLAPLTPTQAVLSPHL